MDNYTKEEIQIFKKLNSPKKIQDFLETLKINFEERGDTCFSPRFVIKTKKAHCMEGALLAAAVLEFHGQEPLVLDLRSEDRDFDHVVAVFKQFGHFGAISKTNHAVLRFREPIYKTIRELVMSYFHEYFDDSGRKTLREYSKPFDLGYFDHNPSLDPSGHPKNRKAILGETPTSPQKERDINWRTSEKNLFAIPDHLDKVKHYKIMNSAQVKNLRKADKLEIQAGKLVAYKKQTK